MKINFGCGANRLEGWQNYDCEVDISLPLVGQFPDDSADFIFAEHVVEHIEYEEALNFFGECKRILRPGGVVRICVPSIERIMLHADADYINFIQRHGWTKIEGVRGAMDAILFNHGHRAPWTDGLLKASLFYVGLEPEQCDPNQSRHDELRNIDGHSKVIGWKNNWIETSIFEGLKGES